MSRVVSFLSIARFAAGVPAKTAVRLLSQERQRASGCMCDGDDGRSGARASFEEVGDAGTVVDVRLCSGFKVWSMDVAGM